MKQLIPMDDYGILCDARDTMRVNSVLVAQMFGKEHNHVLRDVVNLDCSDEFRLSNYGLSYYINDQNKRQPCTDMTRDGFIFLAMGYRGKKAAQFKEAYIRRFNEMERTIKALITARAEFPLLTDSIRLIHDAPKPYHFSNECDMLNKLVIGMTAKQFREKHGLEKCGSIRPHLTVEQIETLDTLQKVDIGLLVSVPDFQQRKRYLEWYLAKQTAA